MSRIFNVFKFIFGWPLSLAAIFFIGEIIFSQSESFTTVIKAPNLTLLIPGILLLSSYFFLRSYVWKRLLEEKNHSIPLKEVSYLWGISEFKRYTPGFIWAFVGKTLSFSQKGVDRKTIANLILIEISFFMLGTVAVSLLSLSFIVSNFFQGRDYIIPLALIFIFLGLIIFIFNRNIIGKIKIPVISHILKLILPDFSPYSNFELLAISIFSHFIFGLGTFLTITSITYLPIEKSLALVGLFTLSLLVGYLSIVAPMGLGVREGFMTFVLLKFIPVQIAGISSIFARIMLILSEVIFLIFIFLWKNLSFEVIERVENFIKKHPYEIMLFFLISLYTIYFTYISFLRYDNFFTGKFDLGNMEQAVWNTLHGRPFMFTDPDLLRPISRLSYHADFLLVLLTPFYFLWPHAKMLLLTQTIVLGIGAIFVYLISKEVSRSKNISLVFSTSYLLYPSLQFVNLYDFHPVAFATTFLLGAFYFMLKRKYIFLLTFLFLAGISKENVWAVIVLFGIYIFVFHKKKLLGASIALVSGLLFYLLILVVIPSFRGSGHFALEYYSELGNSPTSVIKTLIFSPQLILPSVFMEGTFSYLIKIFAPTGFLSLLSPLYLIPTGPDFAINLLSSNPNFRQIFYQYTAVITPFIFISSVYAVRFLLNRQKILRTKFFVWYILFFSLVSAYFFGPLPLAKYPSISVFKDSLPYSDDVEKVLKTIPENVKVSASNNLGAHLAQREHLYTIPLGLEEADYIAFLLNDQFAQPSLYVQRQMANVLERSPNYQKVYEKGDFVLFKKIY